LHDVSQHSACLAALLLIELQEQLRQHRRMAEDASKAHCDL
jgi:hypothetical protein